MQFIHRVAENDLEINVGDTSELFGERGLFRLLQFADEAIQGALDLQHPHRIVLAYQRAIVHLMAANIPDFEHVFMIGHGIGTIARYYADKRFKVAEANGQIVELSRSYFDYQLDNVVVGDGRVILEKEASHRYDYVVLDAFTAKGTPRHLTSVEFFRTVADKLDTEGAVILNVMGKGGGDSRIADLYATLAEVFAYTQVFAPPASETVHESRNLILMGGASPIAYQARQMAGFLPVQPDRGRLIHDWWD